MPSERTPLAGTASPPRGVWKEAETTDSRSPCPVINSLANHGYIARNGRNIRASEFYNGLSTLGLSRAFRAAVSYPIMNEHVDPTKPVKKLTFFQKVVAFFRNPWSVLWIFGMRRPNQVDKRGVKVLDLEQLATHGAVEHDASLTRRDFHQKGNNCKLQKDLVENLLKCSSDGENITLEDMAAYRKLRIQEQLYDNPYLEYGEMQHTLACGEMALIFGAFGDGKSVPCSYVKALFQDERLPIEEGWERRWWWPLGLIELSGLSNKLKAVIGLTFEK